MACLASFWFMRLFWLSLTGVACPRAGLYAGVCGGQRQQGRQRAGRAVRGRPVPLQGPAARHNLLVRSAEGVRQVRGRLDAAGQHRLPQRLLRQDVRQVPVAVRMTRAARLLCAAREPAAAVVPSTLVVLRVGGAAIWDVSPATGVAHRGATAWQPRVGRAPARLCVYTVFIRSGREAGLRQQPGTEGPYGQH